MSIDAMTTEGQASPPMSDAPSRSPRQYHSPPILRVSTPPPPSTLAGGGVGGGGGRPSTTNPRHAALRKVETSEYIQRVCVENDQKREIKLRCSTFLDALRFDEDEFPSSYAAFVALGSAMGEGNSRPASRAVSVGAASPPPMRSALEMELSKILDNVECLLRTTAGTTTTVASTSPATEGLVAPSPPATTTASPRGGSLGGDLLFLGRRSPRVSMRGTAWDSETPPPSSARASRTASFAEIDDNDGGDDDDGACVDDLRHSDPTQLRSLLDDEDRQRRSIESRQEQGMKDLVTRVMHNAYISRRRSSTARSTTSGMSYEEDGEHIALTKKGLRAPLPTLSDTARVVLGRAKPLQLPSMRPGVQTAPTSAEANLNLAATSSTDDGGRPRSTSTVGGPRPPPAALGSRPSTRGRRSVVVGDVAADMSTS